MSQHTETTYADANPAFAFAEHTEPVVDERTETTTWDAPEPDPEPTKPTVEPIVQPDGEPDTPLAQAEPAPEPTQPAPEEPQEPSPATDRPAPEEPSREDLVGALVRAGYDEPSVRALTDDQLKGMFQTPESPAGQ